ncbi:dipeptidyl peptidase 9-like [Haliotis cracherodii]|uniref:dipeptidyl peptidase 9-like n=1 Tax=Haliotis cracherodii TaxID=6455 RepID=UPI0039E92680
MASEVGVDPYDHVSGSPPQTNTTGKKSWDELRKCVRDTRKLLTALVSSVPTSFTFRNISTDNGTVTRLYFLGVPIKGRENTLLYVDLPSDFQDYVLPWQSLLDSFQPSSGQLSREEQLMRERKRLGIYGITSYDVVENEGKFVFPACSSLFTCVDNTMDCHVEDDRVILPTAISTSCLGARLDPKICPLDTNLVSFIHNGDLWITHLISGQEKRLTFVHKGEGGLAADPCVAGVPSFVVQEEFDRYTGYWWMPKVTQSTDEASTFRILYEEVDESDVEILHVFAPVTDDQGIDEYRYPRAGTTNARSTLKIIEFEVGEDGSLLEGAVERHMMEPLSSFCPWMEYIVRAGWTPDSKYVYAQVLDREQQQLAVILIPFEYFMPISSDIEMSSFDTSSYPPLQFIYRETSNIWINVHDILHFFPQSSPDEISFLWSSEKSGYRHLYHVTSKLQTPPPDSNHAMELEDRSQDFLQSQMVREVAVTQGDWEVNGKQIWVDELRKLVYFNGLKDSPLETHLYCVSYNSPGEPVRLTQSGFSHTVSLDKACSLFVSVYSSVQHTPRCKVYRISHGDHPSQHTQAEPCGTVISSTSCPEYRAPELFSYPSKSGYTMHGMYYHPHNYDPGARYPTVLFVYGGPQVQLVTNAFKGLKFLRLHTLASQGYAVVTIDGRGSCNRGLQFESHIKGKLGTVEIEEQVEGLLWLASKVDFIDLTRIAIHGWSYGGYLALMGLAQRPDIFKAAIAGAPVVNWILYDTGYTERYLDVPQANKDGYTNGSVLSYIDRFPDEENRLLIIHGLIDENVHFHHTSHLVNALVKACKPYQLQVYPNERHGIRSHESSEHYKTMVLSFLQNHL